MEIIVRNLQNLEDKKYNVQMVKDHFQPDDESFNEIVFVSGNHNKVFELMNAFGDQSIDEQTREVSIRALKLDLPELQARSMLDIVEGKCRVAFDKVNKDISSSGTMKAVLVEDTSLNLQALNGMPGPYIKWFLEAIGSEGVHKMLTSFDDKSAQAICVYALMTNKSRIILCSGSIKGRITSPRGGSWGWDPIFEEESTRLTFGEMSQELKSKLSHRSNAIKVLKQFMSAVGVKLYPSE